MCEVASCTLHALAGLLKILAQAGLGKVRQHAELVPAVRKIASLPAVAAASKVELAKSRCLEVLLDVSFA